MLRLKASEQYIGSNNPIVRVYPDCDSYPDYGTCHLNILMPLCLETRSAGRLRETLTPVESGSEPDPDSIRLDGSEYGLGEIAFFENDSHRTPVFDEVVRIGFAEKVNHLLIKPAFEQFVLFA